MKEIDPLTFNSRTETRQKKTDRDKETDGQKNTTEKHKLLKEIQEDGMQRE